jgi:hypothetical protein
VTDVAVYGATAAGVTAAAAARRAGACTTLVEPSSHIGGMVSGGLGWTDVGDTRVLGGLARHFYQAVADRYGAGLWEVKGPEPHVAEELLAAMLDGVDLRLREHEPPDAAVYVDASYEGDLLPRFGVPYAVGRESRDAYAETGAGRQPATRPGRHNFGVPPRRSRTTARSCRTSAGLSSTTAAGPSTTSARATPRCRPTRTASA